MQQPNHLQEPKNQVLCDSHHDILSVGQPQQRGLLSHVQAGSSDPLATLFPQETLPTQSLLNHVLVEPAEAQPDFKIDDVLAVDAVVEPQWVILEKDAKLSECMLWQMQEDYYKSMGVQAWESNVPCYITSSASIAESYADMVISFLQDCFDQLDLNEPVYIVEMATGPGRFSNMMLCELERKMQYFTKLQAVQLKYVMTDFTDANVGYWEKHAKFKPLVESGRLDFAIFNPLLDTGFELLNSKQRVSAETVKNPVVAIGNYFFDSIKQDVFRVESKRLSEGLVTLERNVAGLESPDAPLHIEQIAPRFRYRELRHDQYYTDAKLNAVLKFYKHNIKDGTVIFPLGAFDVVRNLQVLSGNRLMLLSSDKAYADYEQMIKFRQHDFVLHGGAFSYMMNYDAIGRYFQNEGGLYLYTGGRNMSLQTVCFVSLNQSDCEMERLNYTFSEKVDRANPITTTCTLLPDGRWVNESAQIDQCLAWIRLNLADPKIFTLVGQQLVDLMPHISTAQAADLFDLVNLAWDRYYYCPGEGNIPFWLSQMYFYLEHFEQSLKCLDQTIQDFGTHEALCFLKGQNFEKLGQWRLACEMYELALEMQPEFDEARQAMEAIRPRLGLK